MAKITYFGHSCFQIEGNGKKVIIDPFLTGNPLATITAEDVVVDAILISHGHGDHLGDTLAIAERTGAMVVSNFEIISYLGTKGLKNRHPLHIGGGRQFDFGWVKLTPAFHGSSMQEGNNIIYLGMPAGLLIKLDDHIIYHAGDTGLFGDMKLIGEMNELAVAMLPIGDNFTMGIDDAVKAVEFLKPKQVIPMHYNTFPPIEADPYEFVKKIGGLAKGVVLDPGQTLET